MLRLPRDLLRAVTANLAQPVLFLSACTLNIKLWS